MKIDNLFVEVVEALCLGPRGNEPRDTCCGTGLETGTWDSNSAQTGRCSWEAVGDEAPNGLSPDSNGMSAAGITHSSESTLPNVPSQEHGVQATHPRSRGLHIGASQAPDIRPSHWAPTRAWKTPPQISSLEPAPVNWVSVFKCPVLRGHAFT